MLVSLVGETQARVGNIFIFRGPLTECKDCKRKTVCFNLEDGILYEIISVREKHHECDVHERGVRVVELKPSPVEAALDAKQAIEGSTVNAEKENCQHIGCDNYRICMVLGPKSNKKYKITKVFGDLKCPDGKILKRVVLEG